MATLKYLQTNGKLQNSSTYNDDTAGIGCYHWITRKAGYSLASEDDTTAWSSANNKIGLVIFGATKKFSKLVA